MASSINALTTGSGGVITTADNSGDLNIQSGGSTKIAVTSAGVAVTGTLSASGAVTAPNLQGPAFSAYLNQTCNVPTATYTKVTFNVEEFDTNTNYDATTNYRFTPTVAGYYQINGHVSFSSALIAGYNSAFIYKNGSAFKGGTNYYSGGTNSSQAVVSALVYLNGSTDYVEIYAYQNSGSTINVNQSSAAYTYFQASMVRSA